MDDRGRGGRSSKSPSAARRSSSRLMAVIIRTIPRALTFSGVSAAQLTFSVPAPS